jgi:hypothetical protein
MSFIAAGQLTAARVTVRQLAGVALDTVAITSASDQQQITALHAALLKRATIDTILPGPVFSTAAGSAASVQLVPGEWRGLAVDMVATLTVRGAEDANSAAGLYAYNITIIDDAGVVAATLPLLLRVTAAGVVLSPAQVQVQAVPNSASGSMQLTAFLRAPLGDTHVAIRIPAEACCWLNLAFSGSAPLYMSESTPVPEHLAAALSTSQGAAAVSGSALIQGFIPAGGVRRMIFTVDLSVLPQGMHSTTVQVLVGDIALTTLRLPVSVLVASVLPCPRDVHLGTMVPTSTGSGDILSTGALVLRNAAAAPHRILRVAVVPADADIPIVQASACTGTSGNTTLGPTGQWGASLVHGLAAGARWRIADQLRCFLRAPSTSASKSEHYAVSW